MTSEVVPKALYHSPVGLYGFQEESIARLYLDTLDGGSRLVVWDTGTGKSHFAMRMATLHAEDARDERMPHDLSVIVCEKGKVGEWVDDFEAFTDLVVRKHHGPNRHQHLEQRGLPQVLVTTYETLKADLVIQEKAKGKRSVRLVPGPFFERIKGLSVDWYFDESGAKLGNRSAVTWQTYNRVMTWMRKANPRHRAFALTATPLERDMETVYNQCLILEPSKMPLVKEFEEWFVASRHPVFKTPRYRRDQQHLFAALVEPIMDRRRKTDPDIVAQFPKKTERSAIVEMARDQMDLYLRLEGLQESLGDPDNPIEPVPGLWTLLRLAAGHPAAIPVAARQGSSVLAKALVEEWGEEYFNSVSSAKEAELLTRLEHVVKEEGQKAVVFTFFGQTILPVLAQTLTSRKHRFKVYANHGGLTEAEQADVRRRFKEDPDPCIFLTSDAGARGINLPEATHVYEFESALSYANRTQRLDRIHRITSTSPTVTCTTLVADRTVEVAIIRKMSERNTSSDILLGDHDAGEGFMSAAERAAALQIATLTRPNRKKRTPA